MLNQTLSLPRERIEILLLEGIHPSAAEYFAECGYSNVETLSGALPREELQRRLASAFMLGIRSRTDLDAELMRSARKLFAIGCFCIGTNQVELEAAADCGMPVFNAPHASTRSVAELVLGVAVMLLRGIFSKSSAAHRGEWRKSASESFECRGKTLGIIGYGHIGSQVSVLAEAFGMRVIFHDIAPKLPLGNARSMGSLEALLSEADIVTLHVPDTPQTQNLIAGGELERMRRGSYLINASRGRVVDLEALAVALEEGRLAGAAVDVFPAEPSSTSRPFESPLRGREQVILTPHIGGATLEAQAEIGREVARKLVLYSDRGTTLGAVNFPELNLAEQEQTHRILHVHRNVPGVLQQVGQVFAEREIIVLGQYLQTNPRLGYVVTDIERKGGAELLEELRAVEGTIRTRILY